MTVPELPPLPPSVRGGAAAFEGLPYPLPPKWQVHAAKRTATWLVVFGATSTFALGAFAVWAAARGDQVGTIVWAFFFAAIGLVTGIAYERSGDEKALPAMINAIALSRAEVRPADSWIHFFSRSGPGRWQTAFFTTAGCGGSAMFAWASALAVMKAPWALIATIPLLLGCLVVVIASVMAVWLRWRHSSFGRRPIGISLGRHGLVYYYVDGVDEWPWESIARVRPSVTAVDESTGDFAPGLIIEPAAGAENDANDYSLGGYQSHAWLIYTAVRYWSEHPDARGELSTTFAQRRIEGWRDAMRAQRFPPVRL